ncbi:hypothetical protein L1049_022876 [Liquidambar formosana]|uniref:TmcB/TmcC TPR repeats domain-containing protein n=1 Tax=Liquidambar formosana TaxID=63359 RepID=A0AAP0RDP0_LIQFO
MLPQEHPCVANMSLHIDIYRRKKQVKSIRRALSESDMITSANEVFSGNSKLSGVGSQSFPARTMEEEKEYLSEAHTMEGGRPLIMKQKLNRYDRLDYTRGLPESAIPILELGFSGNGVRKCKKTGGGGSGDEDRSKMDAYYQEMLKSNPRDSLLLRNYGKFLHEVEKDAVRAEEYYGRAILESPRDGEVLSLYGKLIWDTHRDENRAKSYFDHAVSASPNDCTVLGSYAHFMWEAEEDEDEAEMKKQTAMVNGF